MYIYETGTENYNLLKEFAQYNRKNPTIQPKESN